jgi:bifunctional UDP-N-acetylglucosamine pyrophosphorylase / glucosamine-1-phosphate N-acetyltransferase
MPTTDAIILAAGKGSRMKATDTNKCLFPLNGKPMIMYPIEALDKMGIKKPIVVVGFARESIQNALGDRVRYAVQEEANGTAKALEVAIPSIGDDIDEVIVLYGDHSAFYDEKVLGELVAYHRSQNADMTLVTVVMSNPTGYGRIVRNEAGELVEIVEEKNATDTQRQINEINSGNGIYKVSFLKSLMPKIVMNELTQEYYLTDILKLGLEKGYKVATLVSHDEGLSMGVNTPEQLAAAESHMQGSN